MTLALGCIILLFLLDLAAITVLMAAQWERRKTPRPVGVLHPRLHGIYYGSGRYQRF